MSFSLKKKKKKTPSEFVNIKKKKNPSISAPQAPQSPPNSNLHFPPVPSLQFRPSLSRLSNPIAPRHRLSRRTARISAGGDGGATDAERDRRHNRRRRERETAGSDRRHQAHRLAGEVPISDLGLGRDSASLACHSTQRPSQEWLRRPAHRLHLHRNPKSQVSLSLSPIP